MHPEPVATYRVQLRPGFGFDATAELAGYLADLGVSHLYLSPCLKAATGSPHGYDGVDPTRVSEALGGPEAHARLCRRLAETGLGLMLDVVPNHLAIPGKENPWWWDVLENGPDSRFAASFDIDWQAAGRPWPNKVLLPVLGDHYGRVIEAGHLRLTHREGEFILTYFAHCFPVAPASLTPLLERAAEASRSAELYLLAQRHARMNQPAPADEPLPPAHRDREGSALADLRARLCREAPTVARAIDAEVARLNGEPDALDALLEGQHYRLCHWRLAHHQLGYRRFFDIKELVGVRVEEEAVFNATHGLYRAWVAKGWVQGLRIDHPDGLREPAQYLRRLREACPGAWIVVEKILMPGEALSPDWPVAGTTGYDFLNRLTGLFIDPAGEAPLTKLYEEMTGEDMDYARLVQGCKRRVLNDLLGAELNRLTRLFLAVCHRHRRHRDHAFAELREALRETAVFFPVYRSYVSSAAKSAGPRDEHRIDAAIDGAQRARPDMDADLFGFLRDLLRLRIAGAREQELAMRFQQLTGPAMAKGVEDTALYRYHRLIALNEVGGDPTRFGVSPEQFHQSCLEALEKHPLSLLASSTHDTKRSEDVRARLALLSEVPGPWAAAVRRWTRRNARHRRGGAPDGPTEYLFYQSLVGAWPIETERLTATMEKAAREAKTKTAWHRPNEAYEAGLREFIEAVMADAAFKRDLESVVEELIPAGRINSLAQALIKLTAPGIPDLYQGTELWDLSLVDPDNRRPVDFGRRRRLLAELTDLAPEAILSRMDEGLPKLWVIRQALHLRRHRPDLFGPRAAYRPLPARGAKASHVMAFLRGEGAVTVTPRLVLGLRRQWADTVLPLPRGPWHNRLTGEAMPGGAVLLRDLFARFPVGLLVRREQSP